MLPGVDRETRRSVMARLGTLVIPLAGFSGALAMVDAFAAGQSFSATAVIPAGEYRGVRLNNVPEGAVVEIAVVSDGRINVLLLHEDDAAHFPSDVEPLASGAGENTVGFSARAPHRGVYYLIIDNRSSDQRRQVSIDITASH